MQLDRFSIFSLIMFYLNNNYLKYADCQCIQERALKNSGKIFNI